MSDLAALGQIIAADLQGFVGKPIDNELSNQVLAVLQNYVGEVRDRWGVQLEPVCRINMDLGQVVADVRPASDLDEMLWLGLQSSEGLDVAD